MKDDSKTSYLTRKMGRSLKTTVSVLGRNSERGGLKKE